VLAEVDDGVGAELLDQPPVGGEVVVGRREVGVVVDGYGVLPKPLGGCMPTKTFPKERPATTNSPPST
jgi:hypothetical protein